MTTDPLTYALFFFDRGVKICPCQPSSKSFVPGFGPYLRSVETDLELLSWLDGTGHNYALLTGSGGLVVVDFDDPDLYQSWRGEVGELGDTFTVRTNRGFHVYYQSGDLRSWRGAGFEVMGINKAVMGAGSVHPDGGIYQPINPPTIRTVETLEGFPLLSKPPKLPEPPAVRPASLGGGVVAKIKSNYFIFDVIQNDSYLSMRVKLKSSDGKQGRWYAGFCPFHDDKRKPSFWVDAERNLYGCRACDSRGDIINFMAWLKGWTLQDTIKNLAVSL